MALFIKREDARQVWQRICLVVIFLVTLVSFITFFTTLSGALHPSSQNMAVLAATTPQYFPPAATSGSSSTVQAGVPKTLSIPSLNVSAKVEETGITTHGTMGTPTTFTTTAWYYYSPEPGDPGISIIDGHVNNGLGLAGVFLNLDKIKDGDNIYVTDDKGTTYHFVVNSISFLNYNDHLSDILTEQSSKAQLALITCEGDWIPSQDTYNERILVLADLVPMK